MGEPRPNCSSTMGTWGPQTSEERSQTISQDGQRSQDSPHLLQGQDLQKAHPTQGHAIQGRKGLPIRARKASIRPQAIRLWWSNEARFPQEGKDNQEGRVEIECTACKTKAQLALKRCKHFELGGDKKTKGA